RWMDVYRQVQALMNASEIGKAAEVGVNRLCELAYLQAFETWGSSDLAGYIADDFELIGNALAMGFTTPWLNALLHRYSNHRFPHGELEPRNGRLFEQLQTVATIASSATSAWKATSPNTALLRAMYVAAT